MKLAAKQGDSEAQILLGSMYAEGEGITKDGIEALRWYRRAAEQGNATAQSLLGFRYLMGDDVPQDYILAHMWFNLAAARGGEEARTQREQLAEMMTPEQIGQAQQLARDWKPRN